ncbi:AarF/UbiB family protein [Modicisalibacter ilicicola]|nr:AarF/UbiB family protein [Halomonas ilicicola]
MAPKRLVHCLLALGPAFVKLGQILSTRPDLLPEPYIDALVRLQADQPPVEFAALEPMLADALGVDWRQRFQAFDAEPVAAASLAQVHRARVGDTGAVVAVKIQRPDIRRRVLRDLDAVDLGLWWARRLMPRRMRRSNIPAFFAEFRRYTLQELDFSNEARTMERFRGNLRDSAFVHLPRVHWEHSAPTVLTMDWIDGLSLREVCATFDQNARRGLVHRLIETLLAMFVSDGLFHADLHPGNIRFHDDGSFTLLDFGMYGELTPVQRDRFILYWVAVVQEQPQRAFHHFTAQTRRLPGADEAAFFARFSELARRWYASRLSELSFTQVYLEMMRAGYRYGFVFPPELILHAKALTTAEALIFTLDPDARFEAISRPVIARELTRRAGALESIRNRLSQFLPELLLLGEVMPVEAVDETWDQSATDELLTEMAKSVTESLRDQLEHGGLWKELLERHVRQVLAEAGLRDASDEILDATWEHYYRIEPDIPVAPTFGAILTTHLAGATLGLYRALRERDVDKRRAYGLIYDTGWRLYRQMGESPLLLASAYTRDPYKRLKIATELFRLFPFGEPGYRWQDVTAAPGVVAFDCLECPVARFFIQNNEPELCVNTWCNLDFPLAEKWGGHLERTGTIASGASRCDFRWHADMESQGGAQPDDGAPRHLGTGRRVPGSPPGGQP